MSEERRRATRYPVTWRGRALLADRSVYNIKIKDTNFDIEKVWKDLRLAACEIWVLLGYNQSRFTMPTIGKRISMYDN